MNPPSATRHCYGFTFVELLLALALSALVAGILGLLIHGLLVAGHGQTQRQQGPFRARAALRTLSREVACAFAPPVRDLVPLTLTTSTEPGQPEVRLVFFAPVLPASPPAYPGAFDIHQIAYEVHSLGPNQRELRRISAPCSGPFTNAPVTNRIFSGSFTLALAAMSNDTAYVEWPPPDTTPPALPASLRLSLHLNGQPAPFQSETLIQCAHGIRSPLERVPPPEPAPDLPAE